jgi:hypothetical protein
MFARRHHRAGGQPATDAADAARPRRRRVGRAALAAAMAAGVGGLLLTTAGIASASVSNSASQWAEIGP